MIAVGNALVDVIATRDDDFVSSMQMEKGAMMLIDGDRALQLYSSLDGAVQMSCGSAANTIAGIASFGGRAAFIGKVADDALGDELEQAIMDGPACKRCAARGGHAKGRQTGRRSRCQIRRTRSPDR